MIETGVKEIKYNNIVTFYAIMRELSLPSG